MPAKKNKGRIEPGKDIVSAWFATVINPMLQSLEAEVALLVENNWTWRSTRGGLEFIRPVRTYISPDSAANFDLMNKLEKEVARACHAHDDQVSALTDACGRMHDALKKLAGLSELFERICLSQNAGREAIRDAFGHLEEKLALISDYIVNNRNSLPSHYSSSKFWSACGQEFLLLRNHDQVRDLWHQTLAQGKALAQRAEQLGLKLEDTRTRLALRYDVPPNPPTVPATSHEAFFGRF